jgi:hypothetical protein
MLRAISERLGGFAPELTSTTLSAIGVIAIGGHGGHRLLMLIRMFLHQFPARWSPDDGVRFLELSPGDVVQTAVHMFLLALKNRR